MAYSEDQKKEMIDAVCERVSAGAALRNVLKEPDMPSLKGFYTWINDDEEKGKQYTRACEFRQEMMFEDLLDIADDQEHDVYEDKDGNEQINHNVINRSKIRIDARKWALSKLNPKKYGDKTHTQHSGHIKKDDTNKTLEELKEELKELGGE